MRSTKKMVLQYCTNHYIKGTGQFTELVSRIVVPEFPRTIKLNGSADLIKSYELASRSVLPAV